MQQKHCRPRALKVKCDLYRVVRENSHDAERRASSSKIQGKKVARLTGLEPATPGVTGRYSNQLSYNRAMGVI